MSARSLAVRIIGLLAVFIAIAPRGQATAPPTSPTFLETACDLPRVTASLRPWLHCGTVEVPRDYGNSGAGLFRLAVVVLRSPVARKEPDPVVFLQGGPGSPLTIRAGQIWLREKAILSPSRDLILLDQRGAGRSEPAICPDLGARQLQVFAANPGRDALLAAYRATVQDCRRAFAAAGMDPAWFGTSVTVEDIERVRRALGISRWTVYGRSYGTTVAMTLLARYPKTLRAVVLDSVYPPDPLPETRERTMTNSLNALFAACQADAPCAAAHPDLASTYQETIERLSRAPLSLTMPPGRGPRTFALGAPGFRTIVGLMLYFPPPRAMLPKVIQAAHDGDVTGFARFVAPLVESFLDDSVGDRLAVVCRDRPTLQTPSQGGTAENTLDPAFPSNGICRDWSTPGDPPVMTNPPDVPSLLLAGGVDPATPPDFAEDAARALGPTARMIVFPQQSHDIEEFSPCGAAIILHFVRDPEATLDTSCATAEPPFKFR